VRLRDQVGSFTPALVADLEQTYNIADHTDDPYDDHTPQFEEVEFELSLDEFSRDGDVVSLPFVASARSDVLRVGTSGSCAGDETSDMAIELEAQLPDPDERASVAQTCPPPNSPASTRASGIQFTPGLRSTPSRLY